MGKIILTLILLLLVLSGLGFYYVYQQSKKRFTEFEALRSGAEERSRVASIDLNKAKQEYNERLEGIVIDVEKATNENLPLYAHDLDFNIHLFSDGSVNVWYKMTLVAEKLAGIYNYYKVAYRFDCFEYPKIHDENFHTTLCPEDNIRLVDFYEDAAKEELKKKDTDTTGIHSTYSLPFLLVDSKPGDLTHYEYFSQPSEEELYEMAKSNYSSIFGFNPPEYYDEVNFTVNFNFSDTSHCIKFPLLSATHISMRLTMPSTITNYTFGDEKYIKYVNTNNNLVEVEILPFLETQVGEVCS